jgi:hypothetical protein
LARYNTGANASRVHRRNVEAMALSRELAEPSPPGEVCVLCVDLDVSERQLLASHGNVGLFWGEGAGFYGKIERDAGILNR